MRFFFQQVLLLIQSSVTWCIMFHVFHVYFFLYIYEGVDIKHIFGKDIDIEYIRNIILCHMRISFSLFYCMVF